MACRRPAAPRSRSTTPPTRSTASWPHSTRCAGSWPDAGGPHRNRNRRMSAIGHHRDIVLDHHRAPRRLGRLAPPAQAAEGVNALCGDRLRIEVRVEQDRVTAYAFEGECCALATATASLLGD